MPLPLLFIGIAAATATFGIGKSAKAAVDTNKAKKVNKEANDVLERAINRLDSARKSSQTSLENLGRCKIGILSGSISSFVDLYRKLKNVEIQDSVGIDELSKFRIDKQELKELEEMGGFATSIFSGVTGGALGGALTAFGAYSAAGTFAAASTGTTIASLSGAAATNATLAFFGGGSLAAGGLGMAGGTMVLGGLVAGPALAIMGILVGAKASAEKNKAYENLAIAQKNAKEMEVASNMCNAISLRGDMFREVLYHLNGYLVNLNKKMADIINEFGADYQTFPISEKKNLAAAVAVVKAIKAVIDTPILTKDGDLTNESEKILLKTKGSDLYKGNFLFDNR
ncbi:MAG: hypothetical protein J1E57_11870 [Prevotella sp.]|nr:hypothetical protein [Prevotella sp.]